MLLGDLIARFQNDASADETLLSLGDLALTAHLIARGAENDLTPGVFVIEVGRPICQSRHRRGMAVVDRANVALR